MFVIPAKKSLWTFTYAINGYMWYLVAQDPVTWLILT